MNLREKIINAYAEGSNISYIAECFDITPDDVLNELRQFKNDSVFKRTFTDEFKMMIAERDMRKVTRTSISEELQLNVATVKRACEKFGNAIKEIASNDNVYTIVDGVHNLDTCPTCNNHKVNKIESVSDGINTDGIYCMECGDEHFLMHKYKEEEVEEKQENGKIEKVKKKVAIDDTLYVYRVNFEYYEE